MTRPGGMGTAGERAGAAYSGPAAAAPKRSYGRGDAARRHRNVRLDPDNDAAVLELAAEHFGGNYSAALDHLVARAGQLEATRYGAGFDQLADRWSALETEHDQVHPDRDRCGGVGGCSMMMAAHDLETAMLDALERWRSR